jgi:hypothetical protein
MRAPTLGGGRHTASRAPPPCLLLARGIISSGAPPGSEPAATDVVNPKISLRGISTLASRREQAGLGGIEYERRVFIARPNSDPKSCAK